MREDLWDMNPGKACAQAAHAQAEFDAYCDPEHVNDDFWKSLVAWREDRSFGVTTVLSEPQDTLNIIRMYVDHCGFVEDPTYPYRNYYGQVFTSKEVTCMWVFATTEEEIEYMKQWKLHQ